MQKDLLYEEYQLGKRLDSCIARIKLMSHRLRDLGEALKPLISLFHAPTQADRVKMLGYRKFLPIDLGNIGETLEQALALKDRLADIKSKNKEHWYVKRIRACIL